MGSQVGVGNRTQEPKSTSLVGQGSIYNLTLDEVQQYLGDLGKPLSSMNLDELLKTVWSAEVDFGAQNSELPSTTLNRQASVTVLRDLSKKTVDEVWQGIQQGQKRKRTERDVPLGETTLEDFLVKAGVVDEPIQKKKSSGLDLAMDSSGFSQQGGLQWMQYQIPPPQAQQQQHNVVIPGFAPPPQQPISYGPAHPMLEATYSDAAAAAAAMAVSPNNLLGTLSDPQTRARKRLHSGEVVEKNVERRHKRMIKNRESAARSRARKQAYTNELEIKVTRLEEENEKLKHQNELEKLLPAAPPPEPKYQLRRTSSF